MRRIGCTGSDDYLGSGATSPLPLITRRYPIICILKPYDACPQVCVYCQRNWEIDDVLAPGAMAGHDELEAALRWIEQTTDYRCVLPTLCCPSHCPRHPAVREPAPRASTCSHASGWPLVRKSAANDRPSTPHLSTVLDLCLAGKPDICLGA